MFRSRLRRIWVQKRQICTIREDRRLARSLNRHTAMWQRRWTQLAFLTCPHLSHQASTSDASHIRSHIDWVWADVNVWRMNFDLTLSSRLPFQRETCPISCELGPHWVWVCVCDLLLAIFFFPSLQSFSVSVHAIFQTIIVILL